MTMTTMYLRAAFAAKQYASWSTSSSILLNSTLYVDELNDREKEHAGLSEN